LNAYRSRFTAEAHARVIRERLFPNGRAVGYERSVPSVTVPSINDPACARFIDERAPDLLAVCGTTVIKPEIFARAPLGAINIHTGITPEYRSADPILWALYNKQPDKVGVTIHFVDKGVDTGAIIRQECIPLYCDDDLASIQARCVQRGADLYLEALEEIATRSVRPFRKTAVAGKAYYSVDFGMLQHLILMWRLKSLRRHLPPSARSATVRAESRR
jgi:methionyl-tRNA formyltransferase